MLSDRVDSRQGVGRSAEGGRRGDWALTGWGVGTALRTHYSERREGIYGQYWRRRTAWGAVRDQCVGVSAELGGWGQSEPVTRAMEEAN